MVTCTSIPVAFAEIFFSRLVIYCVKIPQSALGGTVLKHHLPGTAICFHEGQD